MKGLIASGQLCTIAPIYPDTPLGVGDIVLCKVSGHEYLHLIKATRGAQYQIGNNRGGINGWVTRSAIAGVCVCVE
jgi:hypothetical protein